MTVEVRTFIDCQMFGLNVSVHSCAWAEYHAFRSNHIAT